MKTKIIAFILIMLSATSFAQDVAKRKLFNVENTLAIQGYDPVAYFKQGKALKGKKELAAVYQGVTYYFANTADKETFVKNPSGYEPQYGGWCAYAMESTGEKVEINPETFKIIDGKLYLFYNAYFNNTLKSWNKDEKNLKQNADNNWKKTTK